MVHMNGLDKGINSGLVTFYCRTIRKGAKTVLEQKNLIAKQILNGFEPLKRLFIDVS